LYPGHFRQDLAPGQISKFFKSVFFKRSTIMPSPNVVFVITDDQGYGDLGCHGNDVIQTPNIDKLYTESTRFTDYHVGPTCAPTRAGLMTGRYCNCTGVWHTIGGRSLLREDETTVADFFKAAGYRTGMFGKWHLGDNYPFHPHNRGFDTAVYHGGGGVHQTPDYWGNTYFNDTYFRNGAPEKFRGYCTDIWFDEAKKFIEDCGDNPFFCYIPTNAPHGPFNIADPYRELYNNNDLPGQRDRFYGMITNIDENVGLMRDYLREKGLEENTIFIFMTDNGTANGCNLDRDSYVTDGFNGGLRGKKGSEYDGGHRVPFIFHWPAGEYTEGRDIDTLIANIDFLPTLCDLCDVPISEEAMARINGISVKPLIEGTDTWEDRVIVTDSQRVENPIKWRKCATMNQRWRLVNGEELYDINVDREQRNNVADQHPDVVAELREHYEGWWELVSDRFGEDVPIIIGSEHEPVSAITTHDWHNEESKAAWNQAMIRNGMECNGRWAIDVAESGDYTFELRRWPREEDRAIIDSIPGKLTPYYGGKAINVNTARIKVSGKEQSQSIGPEDKGIAFTYTLEAGETSLETELTDGNGLSLGAYYVYAEKVSS
jgi:arylsulfatase A-like enzyme